MYREEECREPTPGAQGDKLQKVRKSSKSQLRSAAPMGDCEYPQDCERRRGIEETEGLQEIAILGSRRTGREREGVWYAQPLWDMQPRVCKCEWGPTCWPNLNEPHRLEATRRLPHRIKRPPSVGRRTPESAAAPAGENKERDVAFRSLHPLPKRERQPVSPSRDKKLPTRTHMPRSPKAGSA